MSFAGEKFSTGVVKGVYDAEWSQALLFEADVSRAVGDLVLQVGIKPLTPPRFFDEQLGSAVGAIDYVRGS